MTVSVAVDVLFGTGNAVWSYDSPVVTAVSQANSPTRGAALITVFGLNFGMVSSNPSAFIGVTACTGNSWVSDTSFTCTTAEGTGSVGASALVSGQSGSGVSLFSYDGPIITHLTAFNGPTTGGFPVTVLGLNFGPTAPYTGAYSIGAGAGVSVRKCLPEKDNAWLSSTTVVCASGPPTSGSSMRFHVDVDGQVGTGAPVFSYDSPIVTVVSPSNGPTTGGAMLTVRGTNFGASMPAAGLKGQMGDSTTTLPCATVTWTTNNIAVCHAAHGNGKSATIAIGPELASSSATSMNSKVAFSFDAPVVTFLALNNGPTVGGALLTITGMNLGTTQAVSNDVAISVHGDKCASSAFISSSSVTCVAPPGFGQALDVQVTINSVEGVLSGLFDYDARFISPPMGSKDAYTTYTISAGERLEVMLLAKGEDSNSVIALTNFTASEKEGKAASQVETLAGGGHLLTKMNQNSKDPSAVFTWSPTEPGRWNACFDLINSGEISVDQRCVTIQVIECQHLVVPGDTKQSIAEKYLLGEGDRGWQTLQMLNPDADTVEPGQLLTIGKMYTLGEGEEGEGETLLEAMEQFGIPPTEGKYRLGLCNPGKLQPGTTLPSAEVAFMTNTQAVNLYSAPRQGQRFCFCAELTTEPSFQQAY